MRHPILLAVFLMVAATATAQQHTLTNIPSALWDKPVTGLNGYVTNRLGTNLIIAVESRDNVRVGGGTTEYFRGANGKMQYRTVGGGSYQMVKTVKLYRLLGYPNWQQAQNGDHVSMQVVESGNVAGMTCVYYVPDSAIRKKRPALR